MKVPTIRLLAVFSTGILALVGCTAEPHNGSSGSTETTSELAPQPTLPASGSGVETSTLDNTAAEDFALAVEGEGIRLFNRTTSAASPFPFGRPQDEVLSALERFRGPADRGTNQECGAGPVDFATWPDGLSLVFQSGTFAGWGLDGRSAGTLATAIGIGPGSSRTNLNEAYADVVVEQTSLGTEFAGGGFFGVLDGDGPNARVTDMWAGVSCVAR